MPNISKLLKEEMQRIARKELNQTLSGIRKDKTSFKKNISELKSRIAVLEKENRRLQTLLAKKAGESATSELPDDIQQQRITAKTLKSLRRRLGISQAELAKLIGASIQIISVWENKKGSVSIRTPQVKASLFALKQQSKEDVRKALGKERPAKRKKISQSSKKRAASTITGPMIHEFRKKHGISQAAFAKLANVSNQVVSVWEKKKGTISFRNKTDSVVKKLLKLNAAAVRAKLGKK